LRVFPAPRDTDSPVPGRVSRAAPGQRASPAAFAAHPGPKLSEHASRPSRPASRPAAGAGADPLAGMGGSPGPLVLQQHGGRDGRRRSVQLWPRTTRCPLPIHAPKKKGEPGVPRPSPSPFRTLEVPWRLCPASMQGLRAQGARSPESPGGCQRPDAVSSQQVPSTSCRNTRSSSRGSTGL